MNRPKKPTLYKILPPQVLFWIVIAMIAMAAGTSYVAFREGVLYASLFQIFLCVAGAGFLLCLFVIWETLREGSFIEIDQDRIKRTPEALRLRILEQELNDLRSKMDSGTAEKVSALIKQYEEHVNKEEKERLGSFAGYFESVITLLQEKSNIADQKASKLLDRGMMYTKAGIAFYICAIIAFQVGVWNKGFKAELLYGIGSCSVLFIFIEFQSAWFLKQYRQFVDTSTYLIKVKSIFDRYMMLYLVSSEAKPELKDANSESLKALLSSLSADIKWPESYLMKDADSNLAKEFVESLGGLIKVAKSKE